MRLQKFFSPVWILVWFIVVGTFLYIPSLDNGFYYDDLHQIVDNPFIRSLDMIPTSFVDVNAASRNPVGEGYHYRPLLMSLFAVNYAWGGLSPQGYHLVNLAFHIGSAFLVYLILQTLFMGSGSRISGIAAGAVMLLHPFNTEVVNYVTARSSVMATFFYLLSFYAYLRCRPPRVLEEGVPSAVSPSSRRTWLWISLGVFALGLLSKEIVITLPGILLLYEGCFASGKETGWKSVGFRTAPFFFIAMGYLVLRKLVAGMVGSPDPVRAFGVNLLIQFKSLAATWQMLIFPVNLSVVHDLSEPKSLFEGAVIGAILFFLGMMIFMVGSLRSDRPELRIAGFSVAWFYITLLPTTLIPLNMVLQENRGYIAAVAFAFLIGMLFSRVDGMKRKILRQTAWIGFAVLLVLYVIGVVQRNQVWDSELNLWQDAVQKAPASYQSHDFLGLAYKHLGWYEQAATELRTAVSLAGDRPDLHSNLGGMYMYLKREDLAEQEYLEAIRLNPGYDRAYTNLGILYRRKGDLESARRALEMALRIYPYSELALYNLSMVYRKEGRSDKALELLNLALKESPNLPRIWRLVGMLYREKGDIPASRQAFERAFQMDPSLREEGGGAR